MAHQMAQESTLWPSVMIPHWCNSKITWANIVNAVLDFGTKSVPILKYSTMVQQELDLNQFGVS